MQGLATWPAPARSALPVYLVALAALLAGALVLQVRFLPLAEFGEDGFQSQLMSVLVSLQGGTLLADSGDGALLLVHALRLAAVAPFLAGEAVLVPAGSLGLLLLLIAPLVRQAYRQTGSALALGALLLPLAVSGRGVLVAVGVAYLVLYLQQPGARARYLWTAVLCIILSSASVLMGILLMLFARGPRRAAELGAQRVLALLLLLAAMALSLGDKLAGFAAGDAGYEAHGFQSDNVFMIAFSRSTLVTSVVEGQYLRAAVYGAIALYVLYKTVGLMFGTERGPMRRVILCCLPGIALEGLGMLGLFFPVLWLFLRFDPARPRGAAAGAAP